MDRDKDMEGVSPPVTFAPSAILIIYHDTWHKLTRATSIIIIIISNKTHPENVDTVC